MATIRRRRSDAAADLSTGRESAIVLTVASDVMFISLAERAST